MVLTFRQGQLAQSAIFPQNAWQPHRFEAVVQKDLGTVTERPHSSLGWKTPAEFAQTFAPQRGLTLRNPQSSAPAPVAQAEAADILRGLIDKLILTPEATAAKGHKIELFGELGAILSPRDHGMGPKAKTRTVGAGIR